ncbi:MAG: family nucleotidyltransferase substrate binding protein [Comamonadaceae bacterium]|nr:MAG: family nucleotidyltransferase substrate binding protein [Comamonadaceae bacterium]
MTHPIDLTSLSNAVMRLAQGFERYQRDTSDTQIRDGLIQRFAFTYELCHKMLKRYLESVSATPGEFDSADFQYLIRSGNEQGLLLGDWPTWRKYRDMRGKTSHAYDEQMALDVVAGIAPFLREAHHLLQQITSRLQP